MPPASARERRAPAHCAGAGVLESHTNMAAALLALLPGHNAATPTSMRQGSLVSADALPVCVRLSRSSDHQDLIRENHISLTSKRKSSDRTNAASRDEKQGDTIRKLMTLNSHHPLEISKFQDITK